MVVAVVVAIVVWGAAAFGAVYAWAYTPLLFACAIVGAFGPYTGRRHRPVDRTLVVCLLVLLAAGMLQLLPLPASALRALSPSTDAFLRNYDLSYALSATSHPLSINPASTVLGLTFLAAFSLFLVGLVRAMTASRARQLAIAVIALGVILALLGILQKALVGDHAYGGMRIYGVWAPENKLTTPFGPFVNKNHFAGWMLMALPLAIGLGLGAAERGTRYMQGGLRSMLLWLSSPDGGRLQLLMFAAVIMGAALLLTKSRSGLGCLVIIAAVTGVAAARRFDSGRMRLAVLGSAVVLFTVVFAWAGADVAARVGKEVNAIELRKRIWSDSASIIRDFPIGGTGLNTFGTAMLAYQSGNRDVHFQEAHNDYLQILVEGGLLFALPVIAVFVVVVSTIRRRFASRQDDPMTYWLRVGATIGLLAIAVQSIVEFSLQMPGNAALFVVVLAIAMHDPGRKDRNTSRELRA